MLEECDLLEMIESKNMSLEKMKEYLQNQSMKFCIVTYKRKNDKSLFIQLKIGVMSIHYIEEQDEHVPEIGATFILENMTLHDILSILKTNYMDNMEQIIIEPYNIIYIQKVSYTNNKITRD